MPIAAVCCGLAMDRMHGLRLQGTFGAVADYVAKWGRGLARPSWGPGAELGRAHVKSGRGDRYTPFDLLREVLVTGELSGPGQRFRQYDAGMLPASRARVSFVGPLGCGCACCPVRPI